MNQLRVKKFPRKDTVKDSEVKLVEKEVQKLIEVVKAKSGEESEQIEFLQEIENSTKRLHASEAAENKTEVWNNGNAMVTV